MSITKQKYQQKGEVELSEDMVKDLASTIIEALKEHIYTTMPTGIRNNTGGMTSTTKPLIEIDESVVDVGVSTDGIEKTSSDPLAEESTSVDSLSAREKLKKLKEGK